MNKNDNFSYDYYTNKGVKEKQYFKSLLKSKYYLSIERLSCDKHEGKIINMSYQVTCNVQKVRQFKHANTFFFFLQIEYIFFI